MDNEELIRQLQNENDQLKREIEFLKGHIANLESQNRVEDYRGHP